MTETDHSSDDSLRATSGDLSLMKPLARERSKLFDEEAERYDRCRPTYPDALIDDLLGPTQEGLECASLSPMSSSLPADGDVVVCDVGEHGRIQDVGQSSLEGTHPFFVGRSGFSSKAEKGDRVGM